jgi:hypothetical protein
MELGRGKQCRAAGPLGLIFSPKDPQEEKPVPGEISLYEMTLPISPLPVGAGGKAGGDLNFSPNSFLPNKGRRKFLFELKLNP